MPPRATVLVPTFDHGPTLRYSLGSALRQTVEELELFVVGDGAPDITREILRDLAASDSRVRFFDNPKGPRHGELHRARALAEAAGEIVCYLADDDLWTPFHVESMLEWLADADFAHTLPLKVLPDQRLAALTIDLEDPRDRELELVGENRIPLACSGHTLAAYRRLPHGWRTTPPDVFTDLYMYQQFLADPAVRAVSGTRPTCLHFASPERAGWSVERRCAELEEWFPRVTDRDWTRTVLPQLALDIGARGRAAADAELRGARREVAALGAEVEGLGRELRRQEEAAGRARHELRETELALAATREELEQLHRTIHASVAWRLRRRVLRLPILSGPLRWLARRLAGPADP